MTGTFYIPNRFLTFTKIEEDLENNISVALKCIEDSNRYLRSSLSDKIKVIYSLKYRFGLMGLIRLLHNLAQVHDRHESYLSKGIMCVRFFIFIF